jgi:ABC-type polysaccharide/polyol phosphate transport system ATPase subunit
MSSIIEFAELGDFIDTPVKYYSTGMALRLAFTLATEVIPDILILDELYAGGDVSFVEKGNRRLDAFVRSSKILILVAHQTEYIERFCNQVIVMEKGQIVGAGTPGEMIPRYLAHMHGEKGVFGEQPTA